jgi:hypothetical protein
MNRRTWILAGVLSLVFSAFSEPASAGAGFSVHTVPTYQVAQMGKGGIPLPRKDQDQVREKIIRPLPQKPLPGQREEYIPCPAERVTTEVTTRIAHPWWSTPQEGEIEKVEVIRVGGKPTLLCSYRAYNDVIPVMREFPPGKSSCYPKGRGFVCR